VTGAAQPAAAAGIALLERAIGYTRTVLAAVAPPMLCRATPCAGWDLRQLLVHMDDSLAALTEATADLGVGMRPVALPADDQLGARLRTRACALIAAWLRWDARRTHAWVGVGDLPLPAELLLATGSVEIAVHGWDVAVACGLTRPVPDALAAELLPYVPVLLDIPDAHDLFGSPVRSSAGPGEQLLASLGRSARR